MTFLLSYCGPIFVFFFLKFDFIKWTRGKRLREDFLYFYKHYQKDGNQIFVLLIIILFLNFRSIFDPILHFSFGSDSFYKSRLASRRENKRRQSEDNL